MQVSVQVRTGPKGVGASAGSLQIVVRVVLRVLPQNVRRQAGERSREGGLPPQACHRPLSELAHARMAVAEAIRHLLGSEAHAEAEPERLAVARVQAAQSLAQIEDLVPLLLRRRQRRAQLLQLRQIHRLRSLGPYPLPVIRALEAERAEEPALLAVDRVARRAGALQNIPSWRRAASDIMEGFQAGSHTRSISADATPGTASTRALTSPGREPATGQPGEVRVILTWTLPPSWMSTS